MTKFTIPVIYIQSGSLTLTNSVFKSLENTADYVGGVIYINLEIETDKV